MTPEQKAAQEALQMAIEAHVKAYRTDIREEDPPEMTGDWVMVANLVSFKNEGEGGLMSAYYVAYSQGEMAEHRASGLLRVGERLVFEDGWKSE